MDLGSKQRNANSCTRSSFIHPGARALSPTQNHNAAQAAAHSRPSAQKATLPKGAYASAPLSYSNRIKNWIMGKSLRPASADESRPVKFVRESPNVWRVVYADANTGVDSKKLA